LRAFCSLREDTRLFHIGRINSAELTEDSVPPETDEPDQLSQSFGIFKGKPRYLAKILFTSTAAELVRNQYWHKDQRMLTVEEGVELQLPVSDDREIVMKILQYGAMARPLSPPELVKRVQNEIDAMVKLYLTDEES
jgi:predicted DNA-binding transcriptional regulator YafY